MCTTVLAAANKKFPQVKLLSIHLSAVALMFVYRDDASVERRIQKDDPNGYNSRVMIGLVGLFSNKALARYTASHVSDHFCPFCPYVSNHPFGMNNHICMHLRLALMCGIDNCCEVFMSAREAWEHGKSRHGVIPDSDAVGKVRGRFGVVCAFVCVSIYRSEDTIGRTFARLPDRECRPVIVGEAWCKSDVR